MKTSPIGRSAVPQAVQRQNNHQRRYFPLRLRVLHHPAYRLKYEQNLKREFRASLLSGFPEMGRLGQPPDGPAFEL